MQTRQSDASSLSVGQMGAMIALQVKAIAALAWVIKPVRLYDKPYHYLMLDFKQIICLFRTNSGGIVFMMQKYWLKVFSLWAKVST